MFTLYCFVYSLDNCNHYWIAFTVLSLLFKLLSVLCMFYCVRKLSTVIYYVINYYKATLINSTDLFKTFKINGTTAKKYFAVVITKCCDLYCLLLQPIVFIFTSISAIWFIKSLLYWLFEHTLIIYTHLYFIIYNGE